jgi:predicted metal-binding membrane protein
MVSSAPDLTSRILRNQRLIIAAVVALLAGLAWAFLLAGAGMPGTMSMPGMAPPFAALLLMWWLMMVAMMLPSAAPAILLYARVRQMRRNDAGIAQSWVFVAGYLAVWFIFALLAAGAQQLITGASMAIAERWAKAALLIAAGIYQLSPLKAACLSHCRSPAQFITLHWRGGVDGAVRLGLLHGAYCVGCCWALMALLFVGGIMNIGWIVLLTLIVAAEKLAPGGVWIGRIAGAILIAWGSSLLLG